jgi:uncharacterized protein YdhG (YjbR/CyaY superfamily)
MVRLEPLSVDAYMAEASPRFEPSLQQVRALARRVLEDHVERMQWGMPAYVRDGQISFGFAERKQYLSLYFVNFAVLERNLKAIAGLNHGKGCVRYRNPAKVDWGLVEKLLIATREATVGDNPSAVIGDESQP